jgi:hypothetical protein
MPLPAHEEVEPVSELLVLPGGVWVVDQSYSVDKVGFNRVIVWIKWVLMSFYLGCRPG